MVKGQSNKVQVTSQGKCSLHQKKKKTKKERKKKKKKCLHLWIHITLNNVLELWHTGLFFMNWKYTSVPVSTANLHAKLQQASTVQDCMVQMGYIFPQQKSSLPFYFERIQGDFGFLIQNFRAILCYVRALTPVVIGKDHGHMLIKTAQHSLCIIPKWCPKKSNCTIFKRATLGMGPKRTSVYGSTFFNNTQASYTGIEIRIM